MSDASHRIEDGHRIAARVIFPPDGDRDVLPLYLDRNDADRQSGVTLHPEDVLGRHSVRVRAGEHISLGSYFNAFPASYWKRWTVARTVRLRASVSGQGTFSVYRSTARGTQQRVEAIKVDGEHQQVQLDLPLNTFGDGGWYWFDLSAGLADLVLDEAAWWVPAGDRPHGKATIATTTLNKTEYIVSNMNMMADDADLLGVVDQILVVDHGSQKVVEAEGYPEVVERLGGRLEVIEQPNLGGSGGFARGQYEATARGISDYVILMDDDISIEPETIIRMVTFADMCKTPTLVGGHMFDLLDRSVLYTFGEIVDRYTWGPTLPKPNHYQAHNFNRRGLRESVWLHQRTDVDYNGWWCCLIPTDVIRKIGLSLPLFIKWDDTEYGLRALKAGFPTVSLPGAAVWHVSWIDKDDLVGWQAYFHNRNRIITGLIHSPHPRGGGMIANAEINDLKHLVSMQYYTVAGRLMGEQDVLAGPDQLHALLGTRIGDVRAMAKDYDDSTLKPDYEDYPPAPPARPGRPHRTRRQATTEWRIQADLAADEERPVSKQQLVKMGLKALARQFKPVAPGAHDAPQTTVEHINNQWWKVAQLDSALVTNAEGTGIAWYRRQPKMMRRMLLASARNYAQILRRWDELSAQYRQALPEITSFEAWEDTFKIPADQRMAARAAKRAESVTVEG